MSRVSVSILGVGLLGPGLTSWADSAALLRASSGHSRVPSVLPAPQRLPAAERRRAGAAIKLAMAVADEAVLAARVDPRTLATVFAASSGEGANCHALCEALAGPDRAVSPTRFTNSVHNAAAGYWHIAVASRAASTSLSGFDAGFGAGLLEAVTQVVTSGAAVLLVVADTPYPEPLHAVRPLSDHFGVALLLAPADAPGARATLDLAIHPARGTLELAPTPCAQASLEALRTSIPAAAGLPLLEALAQGAGRRRVVLQCPPRLQLHIDVTPELS
jgi:Beta-ketoacyl synthase, N-terminal domain